MQKKIIITAILIVLFFSPPSLLAGAGYLLGGVGGGGSAGDIGFSLEGGAAGIEINGKSYLIGGGIPLIPHGYDVDFDIDQPCPHGSECVSAGDGNEGTELGLFARAGIEAIYPGMYISGLLGMTRVTEIEVSKKEFSDNMDRTYKESEEKKNYWLYGVGVTYFKEVFDEWQLCFQLDLDNRRGLTAGIGFYW